MSALKHNWLTEDHIDFEYKKYMVLGYMQDVRRHYEQKELYPSLAELLEHYRNLKQIKENAAFIKKGFSKDVESIDWQRMQLIRRQESMADDLMRELDLIMDFAMPLFAEKIADGRKLYDTVEQNLSISGVGIMPLRKEEGYIILNTFAGSDAHVYQYCFSLIEKAEEKYRSLQTEYVANYTYSIHNSFEKMKHDIILKRKDLPNPAVYVISSAFPVPFTETFLPVAKRFFIHKMAANI